MHIGSLQTRVAQILDEERINPTVDYELTPEAHNNDVLRQLANPQGLSAARKLSPRQVTRKAWEDFTPFVAGKTMSRAF
jgi:hypothetical protein